MITQSKQMNSKLEENREDLAYGQYDANLDITALNIAMIIPCYTGSLVITAGIADF